MRPVQGSSFKEFYPQEVDKKDAVTPKKVLSGTEKVLKNIKKIFGAVTSSLAIADNSCKIADIPSIPESIQQITKGFGIVGVALLPFEIAKFGTKVSKALNADNWGTFVRSVLDSVAGVKSFLSQIVSPFKLLKTFNIIKDAPKIPFLDVIALPCSALGTALGIWDLIGKGRTFSVIRSGSQSLDTHENAMSALNELKKRDIKEIEKTLELSKSANLASRVDGLIKRLESKDESVLVDVEEFYSKLKGRATLTLSLEVFTTALSVGGLVINALLLFTPINVLALGIGTGALSLTSFTVWAGKQLFMREDIFDPKAMNNAEWIYDKAKTATLSIHNKLFGCCTPQAQAA